MLEYAQVIERRKSPVHVLDSRNFTCIVVDGWSYEDLSSSSDIDTIGINITNAMQRSMIERWSGRREKECRNDAPPLGHDLFRQRECNAT